MSTTENTCRVRFYFQIPSWSKPGNSYGIITVWANVKNLSQDSRVILSCKQPAAAIMRLTEEPVKCSSYVISYGKDQWEEWINYLYLLLVWFWNVVFNCSPICPLCRLISEHENWNFSGETKLEHVCCSAANAYLGNRMEPDWGKFRRNKHSLNISSSVITILLLKSSLNVLHYLPLHRHYCFTGLLRYSKEF